MLRLLLGFMFFPKLQPAHFGLQDYWAVLKDPPAVVEIMEQVFGTKDFVCREGGGDFNTPGA